MVILKKTCLSLVFSLVLLSATIEIKAQSQAAAFTGTWVLDKEKSNTTMGFPQKLKNYTMVVAESDNLLNVKSRITGSAAVESSPEHPKGCLAR